MKTINVTIKGTRYLLMNRYPIEAEIARQGKGKSTITKYDPEEQAKNSAYWSTGKKKELMIPANVIFASLINGSSFFKIQKSSAKRVFAGNVLIEPEEISLGTDKYEVDIRPVVIQGKSRVLRARARIPAGWTASFQIVYNENIITNPEVLKQALEQAGQIVGICDWRPSKYGMAGTFAVTKFDVQK